MSDKESHVTKCHLTIWGGVNCTDDLPLKSPSTIYPPPQNRPILSKISDTQHHALLHKGLFRERPIICPNLHFRKFSIDLHANKRSRFCAINTLRNADKCLKGIPAHK